MIFWAQNGGCILRKFRVFRIAYLNWVEVWHLERLLDKVTKVKDLAITFNDQTLLWHCEWHEFSRCIVMVFPRLSNFVNKLLVTSSKAPTIRLVTSLEAKWAQGLRQLTGLGFVQLLKKAQNVDFLMWDYFYKELPFLTCFLWNLLSITKSGTL